jgi:serine/threonine-protein kinase
VVACSPAEERDYTMDCTAGGEFVTCTGGENAIVYVY